MNNKLNILEFLLNDLLKNRLITQEEFENLFPIGAGLAPAGSSPAGGADIDKIKLKSILDRLHGQNIHKYDDTFKFLM